MLAGYSSVTNLRALRGAKEVGCTNQWILSVLVVPSINDFTRCAHCLVNSLLCKLLGLLFLVLSNLALFQILTHFYRDLARLATLLNGAEFAGVDFFSSSGKSLRIRDWQCGDCGRERESNGDDAGETHFEDVVNVLSEVNEVKVLMS